MTLALASALTLARALALTAIPAPTVTHDSDSDADSARRGAAAAAPLDCAVDRVRGAVPARRTERGARPTDRRCKIIWQAGRAGPRPREGD